MRDFIAIILLISFGLNGAISGEVKNSKLAKEMEQNVKRHQEDVVGYTKEWTRELAVWYQKNVVVPQEEAEALGLNPSACFRIKNPDGRRVCVASLNAGIKSNTIFCNQIPDADNRNDCIASVLGDINFCYAIRDEDSRIGCFAALQENSKLCLSIKEKDAMLSCTAMVKHEKGLCLSIRDEDSRWGCLAGFPP